MKITKQRLKEIIAEELQGAKNEGIFDFFKKKKKKEEPAPEPEPQEPTEEELRAQAIERIKDSIYLGSDGRKHIDYFNKPGFDGKNGLRGAFTGDRMKFGHSYADDVADELGEYYRLAKEDLVKAIAISIYNVRKNAGESFIEDVVETLLAAAKDRYEYMNRPLGGSMGMRSSSKKSEFDKWQSGEGDNYNYMTRMEEGKITRRDLKSLIAEELTKAEKAKKKKLEKELDDLKHK